MLPFILCEAATQMEEKEAAQKAKEQKPLLTKFNIIDQIINKTSPKNKLPEPELPNDLVKILNWEPAFKALDLFMNTYSPETFEDCQDFYGDRGYKITWEKFKKENGH